MNLVLRKLYREFCAGLSKLSLRKVRISYGDRKYTIPLFEGIGRFHFVPDFSPWMRNTIRVNLEINRGKPVVDIGANIGQFLLNLKTIDEHCIYFGFEPNPTCIYYLFDLVRLNGFQNATVFPFALGKCNSVETLYAKRKISGTGSLRDDIHPYKQDFSSKIYCLIGDEFFKEVGIKDTGLIKIDVEGYEFEVLQGLKTYLTQNSPLIFVEILFGKLSQDALRFFFDFLKDLGYVFLAPDQEALPRILDHHDLFMQESDNDFLLVKSNQLNQVLNAFARLTK